MRLSKWLSDLSVLAARVERMRTRPLVVRGLLVDLLHAMEWGVERSERERGIDWYRMTPAHLFRPDDDKQKGGLN